MARVDYPAILTEAWRQAKALREPGAPTVISLFAGCGGSSLGYQMAGFNELLAVEMDDNAVATFKLNFPGVPVYHGDIANLTGDQCIDLAGIEPGKLDVLDGSPPCQGFSTAGKRRMDDTRNQLFREFVRLLRALMPRVFVMENVSGLVKGKMKLVFVEMLKELKASGYKVSARLLNAMYFNVPQSRQRLIFIGVRDDLGKEPSHPGAEGRLIPLSDVVLCRVVRRGQFDNKWRSAKYPCYTIPKTEKLEVGYPTRAMTIEELKIVGSFPHGYRFLNRKSAGSRIGNSVPPLFMRAIARHIRRELL